MRIYSRLLACSFAAMLAWFFGKALDVPIWRDGLDIGDRTDMAVTAFCLILVLTIPRKHPS